MGRWWRKINEVGRFPRQLSHSGAPAGFDWLCAAAAPALATQVGAPTPATCRCTNASHLQVHQRQPRVGADLNRPNEQRPTECHQKTKHQQRSARAHPHHAADHPRTGSRLPRLDFLNQCWLFRMSVAALIRNLERAATPCGVRQKNGGVGMRTRRSAGLTHLCRLAHDGYMTVSCCLWLNVCATRASCGDTDPWARGAAWRWLVSWTRQRAAVVSGTGKAAQITALTQRDLAFLKAKRAFAGSWGK